jgi:hypothetical protein
VQLLEALLLEGIADGCDARGVAAGNLVESTEAEQQVFKTVAGMFLVGRRE